VCPQQPRRAQSEQTLYHDRYFPLHVTHGPPRITSSKVDTAVITSLLSTAPSPDASPAMTRYIPRLDSRKLASVEICYVRTGTGSPSDWPTSKATRPTLLAESALPQATLITCQRRWGRSVSPSEQGGGTAQTRSAR